MKHVLFLCAIVASYISSYGQCENTLVPVITYSNNACGQQTCFSLNTTGGTSPYTYTIPGGPTLNPNNFACWSTPGVYQVAVIDASGCTGSTTLIVQAPSIPNDVCTASTILQNGVQLTDTLCGINTQPTPCANMQFAQTGWYTFNSESFNHIQFGAFPAFATSPSGVLQGMGIQILAAQNSGTCEEATDVFCGNISSCFNFEDHFTITPETNYYVRVMAGWTSWVQLNIGVVLSNEPIVGVCGCTNPLSCNYDPEAIINNGSCGYNGCTDPSACNYLSYATCDDGSCLYGNDITGVIFNDINGNGVRDTWPILEPALSNVGYITIEELNVIIFPDASGSFVLPGLTLGTYTLQFINNDNLWTITGGDNMLTITLPTCNGLKIPLTPSSGVAAQVSGTNMFANSVIQCNNGFSPGVWIQNTGTVSIDGTFTMTFPQNLMAQNITTSLPYSSSSPGILTWTINDLAPGSTLNLFAHILGPGVSFVGSVFPFSFSLELSDQQNVFYTNTWNTNALVSCAYDPNDKQATPEGYTDNHFILQDTELEFKIRFQNTGNAPAFDVRIDDQIDLNVFDLSSFEPQSASHSYSTIVQPDGMVQFVFNNIMLPDSNSNEPESHGFVIYKIRTKQVLEIGSVLNNTAAIFFDDNPPIITNTTQHTIFSCDQIEFPTYDNNYCDGEPIQIESNTDFVEQYEWILDNEILGNTPTLELASLPLDSHDIILTLSNPLCEVSEVLSINVAPYSEIQGIEQSTYCEGDLISANASCEGCTITWSDGIENGQILDIEPNIMGYVFYVSAENEAGCISGGEWYVNVNFTPQPWIIASSQGGTTTNMLLHEWPDNTYYDYQWLLNGEPIPGETSYYINPTETGYYTLQVTDPAGCVGVSSGLDVVIGIEETQAPSFDIYPNPANEYLMLQSNQALIGEEYFVYDITGREILRGKINSTTTRLDLLNLSSGSYVLRVGDSGVRFEK